MTHTRWIYILLLLTVMNCSKDEEKVIDIDATLLVPNTVYNDQGDLLYYSRLIDEEVNLTLENVNQFGFCLFCNSSNEQRVNAEAIDENGFFYYDSALLPFDFSTVAVGAFVDFAPDVNYLGTIKQRELDNGGTRIYSGNHILDPLPSEFVRLKEITNAGFEGRSEALAFALGNRGYVGCGQLDDPESLINDFWEYDTDADTWNQIESFPVPSYRGFTFTHENTAYAGGGITNVLDGEVLEISEELYAYSQDTEEWTQKSNQIEGKAGCATYVKNGIGYLVAGSQMYSSGFSYGGHSAGYDIEQDSFFTSFNYPTVQTNFSAVTTDVGEVITIAGFNIAQGGPSYRLQGDDQWIMIDDYPGFTPNKLIGFNQDNNIYVGMGEPRDGFRVEFSKYNIVSEQWTNVGILNAQNNLFHEGIVFQVGDRIFVGTGIDHSGSVTNRMFEIVFE